MAERAPGDLMVVSYRAGTGRGTKRMVAALVAWLLGMVGVMVPAHPAVADTGDPVGAFDALSVRFAFPFALQNTPSYVWGWAADPDAPGQQVQGHIYIDGVQPDQNFNSDRGAWAEPTTVTGNPRPDVASVYPSAGDNSGWSTPVYVFDGQPHTVCAYAINQGNGTQNTTLGCAQIPAAGTTNLGDPQGFLDSVDVTPGGVRFRGWAGDPDPDASPTTPVRVFQDGQPLLQITPSVDRPDVHAVFPGYANARGFDATAPTFPGLHIYCVDVGNSGSFGSMNTSLGCALRD